jgi:hypothetical protein
VEAGGAGAVEREAAEDEELGLGVVGAQDAGAGSSSWRKPWEQEAAEQALDDAVLEVEVDDLAVEAAGVAEHDGADGGLAAPLPGLLVAARGTRRVSRVAAQVGSAPARRSRAGRRQRARAGSVWAAALVEGGEGLGAEELEGGGQGAAEVLVAEAEPLLRDSASRARSSVTRSLRSCWRLRTCSSSRSIWRSRRVFWRGVWAAISAVRSASRVWAMPRAAAPRGCARRRGRGCRARGGWCGLADQDVEHAVLGALGEHEVAAVHDLGACCSLRSMRPLRCSMRLGFQGTSKWNRSAQWFCRLTPSRAASVATRIRSGCLAGSALKACLIASRASSPMPPWKAATRCSALVGVDRGGELLDQVALGVGVLGEDQDAAGEPGGARAGRGRGTGAREPGEQVADAGVGEVAGGLGDGGHLGEQGALLGAEGGGRRVRWRAGWRRLAGDLVLGELGALVVGAWASDRSRSGSDRGGVGAVVCRSRGGGRRGCGRTPRSRRAGASAGR